jgi:hypothetical protein
VRSSAGDCRLSIARRCSKALFESCELGWLLHVRLCALCASNRKVSQLKSPTPPCKQTQKKGKTAQALVTAKLASSQTLQGWYAPVVDGVELLEAPDISLSKGTFRKGVNV